MSSDEQIGATRFVLKANALVTQSHEVVVAGLQFTVLPDVPSPQFFASTEFLCNAIPYRVENAFLEIGPGMGAISVMAALRGARQVVAIDINPDAVANTNINAKRHGVSDIVRCLEGDVFDPLSRGVKFDTIFWNIPFVYIEDDYQYRSVLEKAAFDPGYRLTERFLGQVKDWLAPDGRVFVGFGEFGDAEKLRRFAQANKLSVSKYASVKAMQGEFTLLQLTRQ